MADRKRLDSASAYTIAWIAALPHERAAAEMMIEQHEMPADFAQKTADTNSYTWGEVFGHNVVVASLPSGEYGTNTAAAVGTLCSLLPSIRMGLMVGIGAGIPRIITSANGSLSVEPGNDILLGDVVISDPNDANGGVVQYDLRKVRTESNQLKGSLNAANRTLRSAVSNMRAKHITQDPQIGAFLEQSLDANAKAKKVFRYPGQKKDRIRVLLRASHEAEATKPRSNGDETSDAEETEDWDRDEPKVHYGTIASGNSLIKDTTQRDQLIEWLAKSNVHPICFEMEAAGLMNSLPFLVIRGICDYADGHKDDRWQNYAAAAAAACAREVLQYVPRQIVADLPGIIQLMKSVEQLQDTTEAMMSTVESTHHTIKDHEKEELLQWLCPINYALYYQDRLQDHLEGTGQHFLRREEYLHWISSLESQTLFCAGNPGTGKTMISTLVIQHLWASSDPTGKFLVNFVYCDHNLRDQQTYSHFLGSMLRQLLAPLARIPETVLEQRHCHRQHGTKPNVKDLEEMIKHSLESLGVVFMVVDALDEAGRDPREDFIAFLSTLQEVHHLKLMATSRRSPEISALFANCLTAEILSLKQDVEAYIEHRAVGWLRRVPNGIALLTSVIRAVFATADGMFLIARLHMDNLCNQPTLRDAHRALERIQGGTHTDPYSNAYSVAIDRVQCQEDSRKSIALETFAWLVRSGRPLSPIELVHALATEEDASDLRLDDFADISFIQDSCAGLVVVEERRDVVRLVHATTYHYLTEHLGQLIPRSDLLLAQKCLTYLSRGPNASPSLLGSYYFGENYSFHRYAGDFCGYHIRQAETALPKDDQGLGRLIFHLQNTFGAVKEAQTSTYRKFRMTTIWDFLAQWNLSITFDTLTTPITYDTLTTLLQYREEPREVGKVSTVGAEAFGQIFRLRPLHFAAESGSSETAERLLKMSFVDVNARDSLGKTALHYAVKRGHYKTVELLLQQEGIDVNCSSKDGRTPLSNLGVSGVRVLEILLNHGADPFVSGRSGHTPLSSMLSCTLDTQSKATTEQCEVLLREMYKDPIKAGPYILQSHAALASKHEGPRKRLQAFEPWLEREAKLLDRLPSKILRYYQQHLFQDARCDVCWVRYIETRYVCSICDVIICLSCIQCRAWCQNVNHQLCVYQVAQALDSSITLATRSIGVVSCIQSDLGEYIRGAYSKVASAITELNERRRMLLDLGLEKAREVLSNTTAARANEPEVFEEDTDASSSSACNPTCTKEDLMDSGAELSVWEVIEVLGLPGLHPGMRGIIKARPPML